MLFKKSALVLATSLLAISSAHALTTVNTNLPINISVSAVAPTCTVVMNSYTPLAYTTGAATQSQTNLSAVVTCSGTDGIAHTISAGAGGHASGGSRRAVSGGNYINYSLQLGGASTLGFGDDANTTYGGSIYATTTGGASNAFTSYFKLVVPAGQTVANGTYTDTVVLTTTF